MKYSLFQHSLMNRSLTLLVAKFHGVSYCFVFVFHINANLYRVRFQCILNHTLLAISATLCL